MNNKKRVLILTADAGFGHRSAANAIAEALQERYGDRCESIINNPMEDRRTPFFLRDSQADYDNIVRSMPDLYRLGYGVSDAPIPSVMVESALTVMLFEVIRDLVSHYKPNVIITTYPLYQSALGAVFNIHRLDIPFFTTITDLATIHHLWFNSSPDHLLVPNQAVYDLAVGHGIKPEKVHITGIPIHPAFTKENRSKAEIRLNLGWDPDTLTIFAVGSKRVENLLETLNVINHFGKPVQIVLAAGKDRHLYEKAQDIHWHMPVHLYDYVSNMPTMMHASDLLICKAGGLIITEALACQLPMILIDVIPGQETGNAHFVMDGGAGELGQNPGEVLEIMAHLTMENGRLLKTRANNADLLSRPFAAYDTADLLWKAAQADLKGDRKQPDADETGNLINLLNKFHIQRQAKLPHLSKK